MLVIRLQRTGRKGHAQYRVVVQDSRFTPTSGRVIAYVGSYNPHTKEATLDKDKIAGYLADGAQPSPRVIGLLKADKIKMPAWIKEVSKKKKDVRNPEKRRSTTPKETTPKESEESPVEENLAEPESEEPKPAEEAPAPEVEAETTAETSES